MTSARRLQDAARRRGGTAGSPAEMIDQRPAGLAPELRCAVSRHCYGWLRLVPAPRPEGWQTLHPRRLKCRRWRLVARALTITNPMPGEAARPGPTPSTGRLWRDTRPTWTGPGRRPAASPPPLARPRTGAAGQRAGALVRPECAEGTRRPAPGPGHGMESQLSHLQAKAAA